MTAASGIGKANGRSASADVRELSAHDGAQGLALRVTNLGVKLPKGRGSSRLWSTHHWALRDINFEVRRGEAVGILGSNGSGKSTLLRTIAGIIALDEGRIDVAPDLEAAILSPGAGFENNLTGRENLYNSALYQGYLPKVLATKLDDVVELAGIGDWVDQPVATYSAGMRARLGLSLALHLPPDVLMIDETLSAGDAAFRVKAKQMVDELISTDRTVLLVSHNFDTLRTMCTRGIVLDRGRQVAACEIAEAIEISQTVLLGAENQSVASTSRRSQRRGIVQQIQVLQDQLTGLQRKITEHAQAVRAADEVYVASLEQLVQYSDKLATAREQAAGSVGPVSKVADATQTAEPVIEVYREARQKMLVNREEREKVRAEQRRLTTEGADLRNRLTALRDQLAGL